LARGDHLKTAFVITDASGVKLDKSSSNPDAIRGREQFLIQKNGGAQSQVEPLVMVSMA
jgi:phage FluMu gp28-like protein